MTRSKINGRRPAGDDADTMLADYDFSKAVRGQTAKRYAAGSNIIVLDPDVAKAFPNAASVNDALRALLRVARARVPQPRRKRTA